MAVTITGNTRVIGQTTVGVLNPPLLDVYSGAAAAYSLRKLRTAYTGSAIRVRRSSDNAQQDIGFTNAGDLDESALTAFVGAGNGFVTIWYDQSGNNRDAIQTTTGRQPSIVGTGIIVKINNKPSLNFPRSNAAESLITSDFSLNQPVTVFSISKLQTTTGLYFYYDGKNSTNRLTMYNFNNGLYLNSGVDLAYSSSTTNQILLTGIHNITSSNLYLNGSSVASGNTGTNTFTGLTIGNGSTLTQAFQGFIQEIILYPSNQSTNRAGIELFISNYYNIY